MQFKIRLNDGREFGPAAMETIVHWAREGRVPMDAQLVNANSGQVQSVHSEPSLQTILQAPPTMSTGLPSAESAPLGGLIPYKNPPALSGYYVGIVSWLPLVGLLAGPLAVVLGIKGLRRRSKQPQVRGLAHAWIAIVMGTIGTVISLGCSGSIIAAMLSE